MIKIVISKCVPDRRMEGAIYDIKHEVQSIRGMIRILNEYKPGFKAKEYKLRCIEFKK